MLLRTRRIAATPSIAIGETPEKSYSSLIPTHSFLLKVLSRIAWTTRLHDPCHQHPEDEKEGVQKKKNPGQRQ